MARRWTPFSARVHTAKIIAVGKVVAKEPAVREVRTHLDGRTLIWTPVRFEVEECLKGGLPPGDAITFAELRGAIGDFSMEIAGEERFEPGERLLLPLYEQSFVPSGFLHATWGKYVIGPDGYAWNKYDQEHLKLEDLVARIGVLLEPGEPVKSGVPVGEEARDMKVFGGRATVELTTRICTRLGVEPGRAEIFKFSNDNTFVRILENVREEDVFCVQTSRPPVDEALLELLIMVDALKRASARRITAVLPYYPYVRSDKKDQPRVPITARLVADLLATAGVDRVVTVDLTADQIQGFFSVPADHLTAQTVLAEHFRAKFLARPVVVAPDPGAVKRAQRFAQRLGAPVAFVDKRRVGGREEVKATAVVGDVTGCQAILFDEEVDRGGSSMEALGLLKKHGAAEVYLACTHAVLSGPAVERLAASELREVVVTDTVPIPPAKRWDRLVVLSVAPMLAEAIRRIHTGESISVLFSE